MSTPPSSAEGPRFSVFTPSHDPHWLDDCFASLTAQTATDWEWIVVLNGSAAWQPPSNDPRVVVVDVADARGVGDAKRRACARATGDVLVELDHDDLLAPDALDSIGRAFAAHPEAVLVYSHWGQILDDGSPDDSEFSAAAGWTYRRAQVGERTVKHAVALAPSPHNVSYIWYAPNHVRAFRASAYEAAGGYDASLDILDDQDLMARLYQQGPFVLIDECLYLQRMHEKNTHRDTELNQRIQRETVGLYDRHFEANALAWAAREGLRTLEFRRDGAATHGYEQIPESQRSAADALGTRGLPDGSVGVVRAHEFLSSIEDTVGLLNEFYRLLAPGGILITVTSSTNGRGAFQDPSAKSYWNENSFWYFTEDAYRHRVSGVEARFQVSRSVTTFPSAWHEHRLLSYVFVNLIAIKDDRIRHGGPLHVAAGSD